MTTGSYRTAVDVAVPTGRVFVLGEAECKQIVEAAQAARMAYVMGRPETGDLHIEQIVRLAKGGDAACERQPGD
jgi:hypothetical protein